MDLVDLALYRAMLPDRAARFWGSRMVVDPRVTPMELARRTGLSHGAVRIRLKRWKATGFFHGYEVWVNPHLFANGLWTIDAPLTEPEQWDRVLPAIAGLAGVLSIRNIQEGGGRTVRIYFADEGGDQRERVGRQVEKLLDQEGRLESKEYWIPTPPPCSSRLDWRIIDHFRRVPGSSLKAAAAAVGITAKTLAKRRDRLVDSYSIWWVLDTRSIRIPLVAVYVELVDQDAKASVGEDLHEQVEGWIPCAENGFGIAPSSQMRLIVGLAYADTPGRTSEIMQTVREMKGVARSYFRIPLDFRSFGHWIDAQIALKLRATSGRDLSPPA